MIVLTKSKIESIIYLYKTKWCNLTPVEFHINLILKMTTAGWNATNIWNWDALQADRATALSGAREMQIEIEKRDKITSLFHTIFSLFPVDSQQRQITQTWIAISYT